MRGSVVAQFVTIFMIAAFVVDQVPRADGIYIYVFVLIRVSVVTAQLPIPEKPSTFLKIRFPKNPAPFFNCLYVPYIPGRFILGFLRPFTCPGGGVARNGEWSLITVTEIHNPLLLRPQTAIDVAMSIASAFLDSSTVARCGSAAALPFCPTPVPVAHRYQANGGNKTTNVRKDGHPRECQDI